MGRRKKEQQRRKENGGEETNRNLTTPFLKKPKKGRASRRGDNKSGELGVALALARLALLHLARPCPV